MNPDCKRKSGFTNLLYIELGHEVAHIGSGADIAPKNLLKLDELDSKSIQRSHTVGSICFFVTETAQLCVNGRTREVRQ